jgi:hypothetical protein
MKEGGSRHRRRKRGGVDEGRSSTEEEDDGRVKSSEAASGEESGGGPVTVSSEGLHLEVVLPSFDHVPSSGLAMLIGGIEVTGSSHQQPTGGEAGRLLTIQQQVGFRYLESNEEVIKALDMEEQSDRNKKQVWEQQNGY